MAKVAGTSRTPRKLKYYIYRKSLTDVYNKLLKKKKYQKLYFQILKRFEFLAFKKFLKYRKPKKFYENNFRSFRSLESKFLLKSPLNSIKAYTFKSDIAPELNYRITSQFNKFSTNLLSFIYLKRNKSIFTRVYKLLHFTLLKKKGKLGYLNWSLFYAGRKSRNKRRGDRKGWLKISKGKFYTKNKKKFSRLAITVDAMAYFYGFKNVEKFKKLLHFTNRSSKLRRAAVLNLEGRVNVLVHRLNLLSDDIFIINKFIKRGRILLNGFPCHNPSHVLKIGDNISVSPRAYKFIFNLFKKRIRNKKIWSSIPSNLECNFFIMYFSIIDYPQLTDLARLIGKMPIAFFNSDLVNLGPRHFFYK